MQALSLSLNLYVCVSICSFRLLSSFMVGISETLPYLRHRQQHSILRYGLESGGAEAKNGHNELPPDLGSSGYHVSPRRLVSLCSINEQLSIHLTSYRCFQSSLSSALKITPRLVSSVALVRVLQAAVRAHSSPLWMEGFMAP